MKELIKQHRKLSKTLASDHPDLSPARLMLLKFYSDPAHLGASLSLGREVRDKLITLIHHLFTDEEAEIARHLHYYIIKGRTAAQIAKKVNRPVDEVEEILARLADEKRVLFALGDRGKNRKYRLMPLMPGAFEMILMEDKETEWSRTFGRLYMDLYNTGYFAENVKTPMPMFRFIPVEETIEAAPMAVPDDMLVEMLANTTSFALSPCACRKARNWEGHGPDLPRETCLAVGKAADFMIQRGIMRRAGRNEVLEVKRRANQAGLATLSINVGFPNINFSCSCCGDCCVVTRTLSQFHVPGMIAPPHFIPVVNRETCTLCGTCVDRCPMKTYSLTDNELVYHRGRCIGCGVCAMACPEKAIRMDPVKDFRKPPKGYGRLLLEITSGFLPHPLRALLGKK